MNTIPLPSISSIQIEDIAENQEAKESTSISHIRSDIEANQKFLAELRLKLAKEFRIRKQCLTEAREIRENYLLNSVHEGKWSEIWSLILDFKSFPKESNYGFYVLAFNHHAHNLRPNSAPPDPRKLYDDMVRVGIYCEALARWPKISHDQKKNDAQSEHLHEWFVKNPSFFSKTKAGEDLGKKLVLEEETGRLLAVIEHQLLFLRDEVFCFYPTADKPLSGWNELYWFAFGFNYLPERLKTKGLIQFAHRLPPKA